jgi:hypothetical protein
MIAQVEIWLIKWLAGILIGRLEKRIGETAAAQHIIAQLKNPTPLKTDSNPPLQQQNNPNLSNPPERGGIPR